MKWIKRNRWHWWFALLPTYVIYKGRTEVIWLEGYRYRFYKSYGSGWSAYEVIPLVSNDHAEARKGQDR